MVLNDFYEPDDAHVQRYAQLPPVPKETKIIETMGFMPAIPYMLLRRHNPEAFSPAMADDAKSVQPVVIVCEGGEEYRAPFGEWGALISILLCAAQYRGVLPRAVRLDPGETGWVERMRRAAASLMDAKHRAPPPRTESIAE